MSQVSRWSALGIGLASVGLLASACAGGGAETTATPAPSAKSSPAAAAPSGGAGGSVAVELTEWSVNAPRSAKAGKVAFTAKNSGSTPHELVVLKTDTDAGALQKNASGLVDEAKYGAVGKTKQVPDGKSESLEATLAAGKYVLICNVAGHYDLGMRTALTVE